MVTFLLAIPPHFRIPEMQGMSVSTRHSHRPIQPPGSGHLNLDNSRRDAAERQADPGPGGPSFPSQQCTELVGGDSGPERQGDTVAPSYSQHAGVTSSWKVKSSSLLERLLTSLPGLMISATYPQRLPSPGVGVGPLDISLHTRCRGVVVNHPVVNAEAGVPSYQGATPTHSPHNSHSRPHSLAPFKEGSELGW